LCYYDYNGNYLAEVYDVARNCKPSNDSITLYSSIDRINMMKFNFFSYDDDINYFGNVLKIFRNEKVVSFKDFRENFVLLDAYHGNHGIYRYTKNLKESDNHWISKNQIEHLFCIEGQAICDYCFYTIKGKLNNQRKQKLENLLNKLVQTDESEESLFFKIVEELYDDKIIMIGHCSC